MHPLLIPILAVALSLNYTVSTDWLSQNLDNPQITILEIGSASDQPHIPGARLVPYSAIVAQNSWPPNELPSVDALKAVFEKAGVGNEGRIVLYSDDPLHATRAWFTLDYLGHGERTMILDGGFAKWQREGKPVTTTRLTFGPKPFTVNPNDARLVRLGQLRPDRFMLIDARPADQFHGTVAGRQVARSGHIPTAGNVPWKANVDANGALRTVADLRALYTSVGVTQDEPVVVYCRSGVEATMPYFVLRSLGYNVALYDGSFTEWSRNHATIVATSRPR